MVPTGLIDTLADLGVKATLRTPSTRDSAADAVLQIRVDGQKHVFALEHRTRAPYPSEMTKLNKLARELAPIGMPLFYAPYVSEGEAKALRVAGWSWADEAGNLEIRAPSLRLRQRLARRIDSKRISRRVLPRGSGGLTIVRYLIYGSTSEVRVGDIARRFDVTQPLVSQVLARLEVASLAQRSARSWAINTEALLDTFLREYEGPGGRCVRLYSLDAPRTVVSRIANVAGRHARVSGDIGADLITSWRVPTHLVVYLNREVRPRALDLVEAEERSDANVVLRYPRDESIFRVPAIPAELVDTTIQIVHPTQLLWDLAQLGGEDRLEERDRLRRWLLSSR